MAEDQAQKTEPATPQRREQARNKGQVAQSRELQSVAVLGAALLALASPLGLKLVDTLMRTATASFRAASAPPATLPDFHAALLVALGFAGLAAAPIMATVMCLGAGVQIVQTGPLWSPSALAPRSERISLAKGLKRMVSLDRLVELAKALFKLIAVGAVAAYVLWDDVPAVIGLGRSDMAGALALTFDMARQLVIAVLVMLGLLALLDLGYQRWRYEQQLRMSKREVRDELRQREGDPLLRGRFKAMHRDLSRSRMIAAVAEADVVVTNPTHYAVALHYDRTGMQAPKVVAKGRGHVATRIRAAAREHDVPIVENAPLARVLHRTCEIGREIPENLFEAVAEILAFVFRLDPRRAGNWGVAP